MDLPVIMQQIEQCAPSAPPAIIEAIILTESGFNPLAININRGPKLARQPSSRKEAEDWARWLLANGYNFDSGLMQINSANWKKLGLTPETVFDACENIRAGAKLFNENHSRATAVYGPCHYSLVAALSAYNTGDFHSGVHNGYVSKILRNAQSAEKDTLRQVLQSALPNKRTRATSSSNAMEGNAMESNTVLDPFTSTSAVEGFTNQDLETWDIQSKAYPP